MKIIVSFLMCLTTFFSFTQTEANYKKTIYFSELEDMINSGEELPYFRDVYFKMDREFNKTSEGKIAINGKDSRFYKLAYDFDGNIKGVMPIALKFQTDKFLSFFNCYFEEFEIEDSKINEIDFETCVFDKWPRIINCTFNTGLYFYNCDFKKDELVIRDNIFGEGLELVDINKNGLYTNKLKAFIDRNKIAELIVGGNYNTVTITNNIITQQVNLEKLNISNELIISNDTIIVDSTRFFTTKNKYDNTSAFLFNIGNCNVDELYIIENGFQYFTDVSQALTAYNYRIENSEFNEIAISNETVSRISLNNTVINNRLAFDNVTILNDFSAVDLKLPEYNIDFTWKELANKLNFLLSDSTNYRAMTDAQVSDEKKFNSYITAYKKFFSVYKNKGDLKSANACYAEMKDVETRRLKYLYTTDGGVDNYLNYKLNVFLKYFAEYGTSPIKSVKISGWVILIFAFFYFFFYSDWDKINRKFLMQQSNKLISYFKSEQKLEELYSDKHKEDLSTFTQFKQNLKDSKTEVPFFFMLFLKPLYWVAVIKHKFNVFLYKRVEFLQGTWSNLTSGKKFFLGSLTFLSIITYGLYLIVIRSLNSLILSINTFTTLGFGDIPVVGISRYVAILEGFLGWFLLSIFSVSLISQILQN